MNGTEYKHLQINTFLNEPVTVEPHRSYNSSQGVINSTQLKNYSSGRHSGRIERPRCGKSLPIQEERKWKAH